MERNTEAMSPPPSVHDVFPVRVPQVRMPVDALPYLVDWAYGRAAGRTSRELIRQDITAVFSAVRSEPGMTPEVVYAWAGLLKGAPDAAAEFTLWRMLTLPGDWNRDDEARKNRAEWLALGATGTVAYAAGMTLTEAQAAVEAETLGTEDVAVLIGLRGWVFPPLPYAAHT